MATFQLGRIPQWGLGLSMRKGLGPASGQGGGGPPANALLLKGQPITLKSQNITLTKAA